MADFKRTLSSSGLDTTYIRQQAIKTLETALVLYDFITPGDVPDHAGSTLRFTIDTNWTGATATNALTNDAGTPITWTTRDTINEDTPAVSVVNAQMNIYGTFVPVRLSDLKQMPKGLMDRLSRRAAFRGKTTLDTLIRATVDGTGSGFGPGMGSGTTTTRKSLGDGTAGATLSAGDQLTAEDVALAVGDMMAVDAMPFSNGLYAVIVHSIPRTHLVTDVSSNRLTWEQMFKYVSGATAQEKMGTGAVGAIAGAMVHVSNNITTGTIDSLAGTYFNLVLSDESVGAAGMDDMQPDVIINQSGGDQPYKLFGSVSFMFQTRPVLLQNARAEILYSAA